jgi:hypothetical protein
MAGVLDQFPLLMAELKRELKEELMAELGQGQWIDQDHSIGRNRHVKACKRLIRKGSSDAYYDATTGRWLIRASALDKEISRQNRVMVDSGKLPETLPPPAMPPVKALPRAETPDDETGVFEREWFERLAGGK